MWPIVLVIMRAHVFGCKQLKELHAHCTTDKGDMEVNLVDCVQQPNGSDCGLFASAFVFEWATASVLTSLSVRIDVAKTRPHIACAVS